MSSTEATIWRASGVLMASDDGAAVERPSVRAARKTKFVPPAKSAVREKVSGQLYVEAPPREGLGQRTRHLVEFKCPCYREEEELVDDGDQGRDGEVVIVENL
jgi:hypothetical protein